MCVGNSGLKTHHKKSQIKTIKRERFLVALLLGGGVSVVLNYFLCRFFSV